MDFIEEHVAGIENDFVASWKADGGTVLGYACVATPVEMITAFQVLPYRLRALGFGETDMADARLSRFNCSFCRSCLQLGLTGAYDFLDGMIETNGCDHIRGMVENWQYARGFDFFHYLKVPHLTDESSLAFFTEELALFRQAMANFTGRTVSDNDLFAEIERQERIRGKLRTVYQIRERQQPGLTGVEALKVFLAGTALPPEAFEDLLDRVIRERSHHDVGPFRARLLLGGSATDEVDFVHDMEDLGGLVVSDMLCFGSRAFWQHTPQMNGSPEEILARLYLKNLVCPRMFDEFPARRAYLTEAVRRARVDGVVLVHNKFCDIHGVDNVQLRLALEKAGVPVLQLEKDYGAKADAGRMRTRVQAFLEQIGDAS